MLRTDAQSDRYRNTLNCVESFLFETLRNADVPLYVLLQDAYDAHLAMLATDDDFPSCAVPAWSAFKSRYIAADGTVTTGEGREGEENARDALILVIELRDLLT